MGDIELQTKVNLKKEFPTIGYVNSIVLLGSCFVQHFGELLSGYKFKVDVNPFGVLFNPLSIASALGAIRSRKTFRVDDLFFYNGLWHSPMHHGSFSDTNPQAVLSNINTRMECVSRLCAPLDFLVLTWGTAIVYRRIEDNSVVANCHKMPSACFKSSMLSVDEITQTYIPLFNDLISDYPGINIILTVSPVRHLADGLPVNSLSKATLLLAAHRLVKAFPKRVCYFPSYELMIDELRDYRFYAQDMAHPSPLAIAYIWNRFSSVFFTPSTVEVMAQVDKVRKNLQHRPLHPQDKAYRQFLENTLDSIGCLMERYPFLDFEKEINQCHTQLNTLPKL